MWNILPPYRTQERKISASFFFPPKSLNWQSVTPDTKTLEGPEKTLGLGKLAHQSLEIKLPGPEGSSILVELLPCVLGAEG